MLVEEGMLGNAGRLSSAGFVLGGGGVVLTVVRSFLEGFCAVRVVIFGFCGVCCCLFG